MLEMKRSVMALLAIGASALIVLSCVVLANGVWVDGVVVGKSVVGKIDGTSTSLVTVTPTSIIVNPSVEDILGNGSSQMTREMQDALEGRGYQLSYVVNIRAESPDAVNGIGQGEAMGLLSTSDIFNQATVMSHLSYRASYLSPMHVVEVRA
jgi:hypothetical protein